MLLISLTLALYSSLNLVLVGISTSGKLSKKLASKTFSIHSLENLKLRGRVSAWSTLKPMVSISPARSSSIIFPKPFSSTVDIQPLLTWTVEKCHLGREICSFCHRTLEVKFWREVYYILSLRRSFHFASVFMISNTFLRGFSTFGELGSRNRNYRRDKKCSRYFSSDR